MANNSPTQTYYTTLPLSSCSYNSDTQQNDIAVIKLDRPTTFSDIILPVCLPPAGSFYEGRSGYVTGEGVREWDRREKEDV